MKKIVAVAALLLSLVAVHRADAGCAVIRRVAVVHHAYVAPLVYAAPVNYGYYGHYNASYSGEQNLIKEQNDLIRSQKAFIQELRQALTQPRPGGSGEGPVPAVPTAESFEAFAAQRCIKCHQDGTEKVRESGFIMFEKDGKSAPYSLAERRRMAEVIKRGEMPPGNTLPLAERQLAAQLLSKK